MGLENIPDAEHIKLVDENGENIDPSTLPVTDTSNFVDYDTAKARAVVEDDARFNAAAFRRRIREGHSGDSEINRNRISSYEKEADRLGDWAQVLHEHPISDEYREAHPGVRLTPDALFHLEDTVKQKLEAIGYYEEKMGEVTLSSLFDDKGTDPVLDEDNPTLLRMAGVLGGDDRLNEVQTIMSNPDTTVGQLLDLYKQLYKESRIDPIQNEINIIKTVLEDVKSGRASNKQPQQEPSESI